MMERKARASATMVDRRRHHNQRGYTLIEMVVTMAVAAVVIVVGAQLSIKTSQLLDRQGAEASRLGSGADLLSMLRRDVRGASAVGQGSTADRLVLVGADGSRVTYESADGSVTRSGAPDAITEAVTPVPVAAEFAYPEDGLVAVTWLDGRRSVTLHLRNHGL